MNRDDEVIAALGEQSEFAIAEVELGIDLEQFLESPHGRYLEGRAKFALAAARDQLEIADPTNSVEVRRFQNDARVARMFMEWVTEGISRGEQAAHQLKLEDVIDD